MIRIQDASYRYPVGNEGLRSLTLQVNRGERVCLLGGNGSGKSTLLRLIAGIIAPGSGRVLIEGVSAAEYRQTGFIFQNPEDQIVAGSVEQELAFVLENRGVSRPEMQKRVNTIAERFELVPLLGRHPLSLSAGEKQRLALASVLIDEPRLLLLDEPTSYLDRSGRDTLFDILKTLNDVTIIAATQFLEEIGRFNRVLFLEADAIAFDGSVEQFRQARQFAEASGSVWTAKKKSETLPSIASTTGLQVINLSYSYPNGEPVLHELSCEFSAAQVTAVLGNSGSGKTTLAKILCGQERAESGEIRLTGEHPGSQRLLDQVALVMQFPESALFAETVFDEVAFGAKNSGANEDEIARAVAESLRLVGLEVGELRDRNPLNLSAGEKRRVAIASTLVLNRPIVIFDEVTAGLDWVGVGMMEKLMTTLKQRNCCVIVISHDESFVERVADRTLVLVNGKFDVSPNG